MDRDFPRPKHKIGLGQAQIAVPGRTKAGKRNPRPQTAREFPPARGGVK